MTYINKLDGKRIFLSLSNKEDLPLYNNWLNDGKINLTFGRSHIVFNEDEQAKYIEDYNSSNDKYFFTIIKKGNTNNQDKDKNKYQLQDKNKYQLQDKNKYQLQDKNQNQEKDQAIGIGLMYDIDFVHGKVTLGLLLDKKFQSKGYGREATNLLLEFAFNILNLNNVMLYAIDFNEKAIAMYKNLGFQVIGNRRNAYQINNKFYDEVYMDLLKKEFNERSN